MNPAPVIAVFDIGKTNKKLFLFDSNYQVVFEKNMRLQETVDDDGDPCEDVHALTEFITTSLDQVLALKEYELKAVNYSTYGASFVYVDEARKPVAPLYNYLKPFPGDLLQKFYSKYEGQDAFSLQTASPALGNLNSGLQLYRYMNVHPELFSRTKYALHLPQYIGSVVTGKAFTDITSIGCHTALWDFVNNDYHNWVKQENIVQKLAPLVPSTTTVRVNYRSTQLISGIGLHDSSAALIPYLINFNEPFILLSTGTWCITLNPFNHTSLTIEELQQDCLSYLSYKGTPVKASRFFAGNEHELEVKRLAHHFNVEEDYYKSIVFNAALIGKGQGWSGRDLHAYKNYEAAYHALVWDIVQRQTASTQLVMNGAPVKRIFVDGGFSQNPVFMTMLSMALPHIEIYSAAMAQASALGGALAIHDAWNDSAFPNNLVALKFYSGLKQSSNL
jgi:sugar (pentulose or hexulose) kinase